MEVKLTVLYEQPFWIGVFSISNDGYYCVCKKVFGSEPKDFEIFDMILKNYYDIKYSKAIEDTDYQRATEKKLNPKRMQRLVKQETKDIGIGTKSQMAINAERESMKLERKIFSREQLEEIKRTEYMKKQDKKKKKKKGH